MKTYPLKSIKLDQAIYFQHKMVDCITKHFKGNEILSCGDLGVQPKINKPIYTLKAEKVIKDFFETEDCMLVRGAGTNAIRLALHSILSANDTLLVHTSPIYPTTLTSIKMLGLKIVKANFNNLKELKEVIKNKNIKACLIQYTRQTLDDSYDMEAVISTIKDNSNIKIITDDNYATMKVEKIGTQLGADLSCFSCFKLQGPQGIGCIVGEKKHIQTLKDENYSGGLQVQGFESLEVLRGLTNAPVSLAIQASVVESIVKELNLNSIKGIKEAFIANAQSRVILVELKRPIAQQVIKNAIKLGALQNPVGAESKYELCPLIYKVSSTVSKKDPSLKDKMIRINPNKAGKETVIRILKESIKMVR